MDMKFTPDSLMLLKAINFAATKHDGQEGKGEDEAPYVSHVFRVVVILSHVFRVTDEDILIAGALHDTLEKSKTEFDDLEKEFGPKIAQWVAQLSKDARLPSDEADEVYGKTLAKAPYAVKIVKLADMYDNLVNALSTDHKTKARKLKRVGKYLTYIKKDSDKNLKEPLRLLEFSLKKARP
jgi:(p)ppGpp synthase/HD superfamily hydrolase